MTVEKVIIHLDIFLGLAILPNLLILPQYIDLFINIPSSEILFCKSYNFYYYYILIYISVPSVSISGEKEMHVEAGSEVVLQCSVKDYLKKPTFIFWYLDNERLLHDTSGVTIVDNVDDKTHQIDSNLAPAWHQNTELYSILTVKEASSRFSGRYSCGPDNMRPAAINIHVILGKYY